MMVLFFCSFLIFIISLFWMQKLIKVLNYLTLPSVFWWSFVLFNWIGSFWVYLKSHTDYRDLYFLATNITLFLFPLSIFFVNLFFRFKKKEIDQYYQKEIILHRPTIGLKITFFLLFFVAITFSFLESLGFSRVPLFYLIKNPGQFLKAAFLREEFKEFPYFLKYMIFLINYLVYPILVLLFFSLAKTTTGKRWKIIFFLVFFVSLLATSLTLQKSISLRIFISLFFLYYLLEKGKISFKVLGVFLLSFIFLFFLIILLAWQEGRGIIYYVKRFSFWFFERTIYYPAYLNYICFEIFPKKLYFLEGTTIQKLTKFLNERYFDLPNFIYKYLFPEGPFSKGVAPPSFFGELYANWGIIGIILGVFLVVFFLQILQIFIFRKPKTNFWLIILSFLFLNFLFLGFTNIFEILVSYGSILVFFLFAIIKLLSNFFNNFFKIRNAKEKSLYY